MIGHNFSKYDPNENSKSSFEKLLDLFMQLLTYTSGDVGEALSWLTELDKEYELTNDEYGMGDFIEDLKDKGYIDENKQNGEIKITPKQNRESGKEALKKFSENLKKQNREIIIHLSPAAAMKSILKHALSSLVIHWSKLILQNLSAMHRSIMALTVLPCMKMILK